MIRVFIFGCVFEAAAAAEPQPVTQWTVSEVCKATASDAEPGDLFGAFVDMCGDTAIIGAHHNYLSPGVPGFFNGEGAAYVLQRGVYGGSTWAEVSMLTASDAVAGAEFGSSVAISGDTAVVGAWLDDQQMGINSQLGAAYVFERSQGGLGAWGEVAKLTASDAAAGDMFGIAVCIDGDTIVVGAWNDDHAGGVDAGSAYVFERNQGGANAWGEAAKLVASDSLDDAFFGLSCDIAGSRVAIGAIGDSYPKHPNVGAVYVFERNAAITGWTETAKLVANDKAAGDYFGTSVAIGSETLVVGAYADDLLDAVLTDAGSAYVFERSPGAEGTWNETAKLTAGDPGAGDYFGVSVCLSGDMIGVGAYQDSNAGGSQAGAAYLFERNQGGPNAWGEVAVLTASDAKSGDGLGAGVAINGATAVVGAASGDSGSVPNTGTAYVFEASFASLNYCSAGVSAGGCQATISTTGSASISATTGFQLMASNVEGGKAGQFYFGTSGPQASPWGGGGSFQCVAPPLTRGGVLAASGTVGMCDGFFMQDLNALWAAKPEKSPGYGFAQAQFWYRDPVNTSDQTTSLSDAVEFYAFP